MNIKYEWIFGTFARVNDRLVTECSDLYSLHYGKWSAYDTNRAGKNIKLSPKRLNAWLNDDSSAIYLARDDGMLVGYAIALRIKTAYGIVSWVTQLVVHEDYRNIEIAKNILLSIWGFSNDYAWGIISANPYAIRALEKTTRRRADPVRIKHNIRKILSIGIEHIPYMTEEIEHFVTAEVSKINTEFYIDHSELSTMLNNVIKDDVPWKLGGLDEGWEWLAFTFNDQLPIDLTEAEIDKMLEASDKVVQMAYKRMDINADHAYTRYTANEVDFIISECQLELGDTLIDFGCGRGRHSILLAQRQFNVQAVDYIDSNIKIAEKAKADLNLNNVVFIEADCRTVELQKAKAAICLYDVVGSYANNEENVKILQNLYDHVEDNGTVIISVMNYDITINRAINTFKISENPNKILSLKPSNTMEATGNIFKPEYYLVDTSTHVIYRREQFSRGKALPIELIVRDRRFTCDEIKNMCEQVGFQVEYTRYVSARDWNEGLDSLSAKEILVKCKKIK